MRVRTALGRALVGASAMVAVLGGLAAPASAGTGPSTNCSDGIGEEEFPILTSPITLAAEINRGPLDTTQQIQICYSTTAVDNGGGVGGWIYFRYDYDTSPGYVRITVDCDPDPTTVLGPVDCPQVQTTVLLTGSPVSTGSHYECVLFNPLTGTCLFYADVPWVETHPTVHITFPLGAGGVSLPPTLCIDRYGSCP